MRTLPPLLALTLAGAILLPPREASAQTSCSASSISYGTLPGSSLASTPVSDAQFIVNPNEAVNYVTKGNCLYAVYAYATTGHAAGAQVPGFQTNCFAAPLAGGQPQLVTLGPSAERSLVIASGGIVYRIRASDGAPVWSYDARRDGCGADSVLATPVVMLRESFPSAPDDLVFVSTSYTCTPGDHTTNRVIALLANPTGTTPTVLWNTVTSIPLDRGVGGSLNYLDGSLFYSFRRPLGAQPSLLRLNVLTGSHIWSGAAWAVDAGDVTSVPLLRNDDRIFVGTLDAKVKAYSVTTRSEALSFSIANSGTTTLTQSIALARGGGFDNMILATTQDGYVRGLVVTPASSTTQFLNVPTVPWTPFRPGGVAAASAPAFNTKSGKLYVGTVSGRVYQYNATNALNEAYTTVGSGTVPQPALDIVGSGGAANRLITAGNYSMGEPQTKLAHLCIPWAYGSVGNLANGTNRSGDADGNTAAPLADAEECKTKNDCSTAEFGGDAEAAPNYRVRACISGACGSLPTNLAGPCIVPCVGTGISLAGNCVLTRKDTSAGCVCDASQPPGGLGCSDTTICSGTAAGCVDPQTDPNNCGGLGNVCGPQATCVGGSCFKNRCAVQPSLADMNAAAQQSDFQDPISGAVSWSPNGRCDYVTGLSGISGGTPGFARFGADGNAMKFNSQYPITSVAVDRTDLTTIYGSAAAIDSGDLGGFAWAIDGSSEAQTNDANMQYTDGTAPYTEDKLNRGMMGMGIQRVDAETIYAYTGNGQGLGSCERLRFVKKAGDDKFKLDGSEQLFVAAGRITGAAFSTRPNLHAEVDGRAWYLFDDGKGSTGVVAYCDDVTNEFDTYGIKCRHPGVTQIPLPSDYSQLLSGGVSPDTGDFVFTTRVSDQTVAKLVTGEDFKVWDLNDVNAALGLPEIPAYEDHFSVAFGGGAGFITFAPGTPSAATAPFAGFSTRQTSPPVVTTPATGSMARITLTNGQSCPAALISPTYLLTSATCLDGQPVGTSMVSMGEGTADQQVVNVNYWALHPDYGVYPQSGVRNNIAVVNISNPITYTQNVYALPLVRDVNYPALETDAISAGLIGEPVHSAIVSLAEAESYWNLTLDGGILPARSTDQTCAIHLGDLMTVIDPSTMSPVLVGLGSMTSPNNCEVPSLFTRVASYVTWLESETGISF